MFDRNVEALSCALGIAREMITAFDFVSHSIEVLDQGGTVGVFPEGRLPIGGKPFPFTVSTAFASDSS